jgi:hypothetical protein
MGFSKFEFRPMESFQYIRGFLIWTVQKQQARDTLFWTDGIVRMQIWVLRSNLYSFGNISIISGIIQIDRCKVNVCLLQVPWSLISTVIFYTVITILY